MPKRTRNRDFDRRRKLRKRFDRLSAWTACQCMSAHTDDPPHGQCRGFRHAATCEALAVAFMLEIAP